MLVCGSPELDMSALQKAAQYEGYSKTDATVRYDSSTSCLLTLANCCAGSPHIPPTLCLDREPLYIFCFQADPTVSFPCTNYIM